MSDLIARLRLEASAGDLPAVATRAERALDGVQGAARRAASGLVTTEVGSNRAAAGLDRVGDQAVRAETRMRGAALGATALGSALGLTGAGVFVSDISKAAFAAAGLETGLAAVTDGSAQARAELTFVRQEAGRLGLVVQTTARDFMALAAATNGTNLEGEKTRQIWLATAEAGLTLGRSPAEVGRGLVALQQIASKGVVSMEEIRQQLAEAIPGATQIAARALNLTSAEFVKLVETGQLTAERFLPAFAAQLREEYGPAIDNYLSTPLGRARVELGQTGTSLNDLRAAAGTGFLEGAVEGLSSLNDQLKDGETAADARDLGVALGEGATMAAQGLAFAIEHVDELTLAAQGLAGVALARFLIASAAAAQQAAAAYLLKAGAQRAATLAAQEGLATEGAALTGVRGALVQVAAAEVTAASAARQSAVARELAAKAALDQARAELAVISSSQTSAQRRAALAAAEIELAAARTASAAATGRVVAAEAAHARSMTGLGQAAGVARGAMGGLLALVGGPWGAAFLAAGAAIWFVTDALSDEARATEDLSGRIETNTARLKAAEEAAAALGAESVGLVTAQDSAAIAAAQLTGEVDKLADAHYRAAAAAKAHAIEEARLRVASGLADLEQAQTAFDRRRRTEAQTDTQVWTPYGPTNSIGVTQSPTGDRRAIQSDEYRNLVEATAVVRADTAALTDLRSQTLSEFAPDIVPTAPTGGSGGGGRSGRSDADRGRDLLDDLELEAEALTAHAAAAVLGEAALDDWRVAQAGVEAVARTGLEAGSALATQVREQAEAVERLAIADERIEAAAGFTRAAEADTEALKRRAAAAVLGRDAMEALRVSEAGLAVLQQARVGSLDELEGRERTAVANAIAAAEARERQAIATEKAEAAGKSVEALEAEIAAETRRQTVIGQGIVAEAAYARAEFIRQEVERAGLEVTDEAAQAIREKAGALFDLQAATDGLQAAADQERELRLMRLSNREREIAVRAETLLTQLARERADLSATELEAMAERAARAEIEAEETAEAIGRLSGSMRDQFIRDGKLGFDEIGDYAEERLRAAVYDALLAEPINIAVKATVDIVNDLAKQLFSGATGSGGWLSSLFGGGSAGGGLAGLQGQAAAGMNGGAAGGLGGSLGGLAGMLGPIGQAAALGAISSALAGGITSALGGNAKKASQWGWLGTIPGLIAGLTDKPDRPYARADVEVQNGQFVLRGTETKDGGDRNAIAAAGRALADQLNALAEVMGLDLSKVENLYTTIGQTQGGNAKALKGDGIFGGQINGISTLDGQNNVAGLTLGRGVSFSQGQDPEAITEDILRDTILRAINAGASDLSEAEKRFVAAAETLDEAVAYIQTARGFGQALDDMLLELTDPAAFERKRALEAVEATYEALKAEAEKMIAAGLVTADVMLKIEELRDLQRQAALDGLSGGGNPFAEVRERLQGWLDGLAVSDVAPGGPLAQREAALSQYQRVLAQAQAGDETALGELTTYADRLLRADRTATGSASERSALYNQVVAEVGALIERGTVDEPLTPGAISGPIVQALSDSQTALADLLTSLPAETAAPLLAGILRQPDWATALLGENAQVPPALTALAQQVQDAAPFLASSIVAAVLATPDWSIAMTRTLGAVQPSLEQVRAAVAGLPPEVAGPIVDALLTQPQWATALETAIGGDLAGSIADLSAALRALLGLPASPQPDPGPQINPGPLGPILPPPGPPPTGGSGGVRPGEIDPRWLMDSWDAPASMAAAAFMKGVANDDDPLINPGQTSRPKFDVAGPWINPGPAVGPKFDVNGPWINPGPTVVPKIDVDAPLINPGPLTPELPPLRDLVPDRTSRDGEVVRAIEGLGRTFDRRLVDLQTAFEDRITDLAEETAAVRGALSEGSQDQLFALRDLATASRLSAAVNRVRAG